MSLLGAMGTAISGLNGQSAAFSNISDNVANSQTVGYKRTDTAFLDYLTSSTAQQNVSGAVIARPDYVNTVQGAVTQTDNPLALAITGQGFFSVTQASSTLDGTPPTKAQPTFSRTGDFNLDKNGYLVNSAGNFLNGWVVPDGSLAVDKSTIKPIQISQTVYRPVATANINLAANLPAWTDPSALPANTPGPLYSSNVSIYDDVGRAHEIKIGWTPTSTANVWQADLSMADTPPVNLGSVDVTFDADGTPKQIDPGGTATVPGTIVFPAADPTTITASPAAVAVTASGAGSAAAITLSPGLVEPGGATQSLTLKLGTFGRTDGVTQFAASGYTLRGFTQDGVPPGSFSSVTTKNNGEIIVNYDNGQARTVAQVPIITFGNPDALQRQNGEAFTGTLAAGDPTAQEVGSNGAGKLVVSATEASNVDIASEFTKLIVAQRAYSANTKVVTTADELLQQTIDMKR